MLSHDQLRQLYHAQQDPNTGHWSAGLDLPEPQGLPPWMQIVDLSKNISTHLTRLDAAPRLASISQAWLTAMGQKMNLQLSIQTVSEHE